MTFYQYNLIEKDPLQFLRWLSIDLFRFKPVKAVLFTSLLIRFLVFAIEISYFSFVDHSSLLKFGPQLFSTVYGVVSSIAILMKHNMTEDMWHGVELWSIDSVGPKTKVKIEKIIKQYRIFTWIILSLATIGFCLALVPDAVGNNEWHLTMFLFNKKFPHYSTCFNFLFKLTLIPIYCSMMIHPFLISYATQMAIFQTLMFIRKLKQLSSDFEEHDEIALFHSVRYQREINRRLNFLVRRHITFLIFTIEMNSKMVRPLFVALSICGFVLGLSSMMTLYQIVMNTNQNSLLNILVQLLYGLVIILSFTILIYSAQSVETQTESLMEVLMMNHIKWYTYDKSNRLTLITIMISMFKPIRLSFSRDLAINYDLGVMIVKGVYSVISVFLSMRN